MRIEKWLLLILFFSPVEVFAQQQPATVEQNKASKKTAPKEANQDKRGQKEKNPAAETSPKPDAKPDAKANLSQSKAALSKEDARIVEALEFLMMLQLLEDYELFEDPQ